MKKLFYAIGLTAAIFAMGCETHHSGKFRIDVALDNTPLQNVFLEEVQTQGSETIDTASIRDASGKFSFTGYITGEGLYRIRFSRGKLLYLALKEGHVEISGDYNHLDQIRINGSPSSVRLNEFMQGMYRMNTSILAMASAYDSLKNSVHLPDSILELKKAALDDSSSSQIGFLDLFARQTKSPVCAVFALSMLQDQADLLNAKGIFDSLKARFPYSPLADSASEAYDLMMNNSGATVSVKDGEIAPNIQLPDPTGKIVSLQSLRGKYVLVDFWASWCAPCRQENPNVVKAYRRFENRNFTILGVSLDSRKTSWTNAILQDGLDWYQVSDLKGWDSAPAATYGVEAIPANFLVDPAGRIIAINLRGPDLTNTLQLILK